MRFCYTFPWIGALVALSACDGSHSPASSTIPPAATPAITSAVVGESTAELATELLLAGSGTQQAIWHVQQRPVQNLQLASAVDAIAVDHLRSTVLAAGGGPRQLGAPRVRRLAAAPTAPLDRNGSGNNLDETLFDESQRILGSARGQAGAVESMSLLPWHTRSAELVAPPPNDRVGSSTTRDLGDHTVRAMEIAGFMRLRTVAARRLLLPKRRSPYGNDVESGSLGLLGMQQMLDAEDTLFTSLTTSGGALGALLDAREYDPGAAPRWVPREVLVDLDPEVQGAPAGYRPLDGASDLGALSALASAACELLDLVRTNRPLSIPGLFRNDPFAPPPSLPAPPSVSWTRDISPLLTFRCGICHLNLTSGGFSIANYESMRRGGNKTRQLGLTFIVPGTASSSVLYQVLTGPPAPFLQMPLIGAMTPAEIATVAAWINGGALENPSAATSVNPGEDLARVSFLNLGALHLDPATGALHHRYEADGPSGFATALATGYALQALSDLAATAPALMVGGKTPLDVMAMVAQHASTHLVDAEGQCPDAINLATNTAVGTADLAAQASMVAGLFACAAQFPDGLPAREAAAAAAHRAFVRLLSSFRDQSGWFADSPGASASFYTATSLARLLTALRLAAVAGEPEAAEQRTLLLLRLRPALTYAEWGGHGEVLGDGIPDTDANGLLEPGAAGGEFGHLPLLASRIVLDPGAVPTNHTVTWSEHIRPLLLGKCGECHLNGREEGHYRLDTRRLVESPGDSRGALPMLVRGAPAASLLYQKVISRQPPIGMPMPLQRTPMDESTLAILRTWIESGASSR